MKKFVKYSAILLAFIFPYGLEYVSRIGLDEYIIHALPGVIVLMFIQIRELKLEFRETYALLDQLSESRIRNDIERIAVSIGGLVESNDRLFSDVAYSELKKVSSTIENISAGEIDVDTEVALTQLPLLLATTMKKYMLATVHWRTDTLKGGRGNEYGEKVKQAIERKVNVKRIFIVRRDEKCDDLKDDPLLIARLQSDLNAGVGARFIYEDEWINKLGRVFEDFGIWDDKYLWIYKGSVQGRRPARLINRTQKIEEYVSIFNTAWIEAHTLAPQVSQQLGQGTKGAN